MLVGAPACLSIVLRHWHDSVLASVCPFECPFAEALLGGRVGDVTRER